VPSPADTRDSMVSDSSFFANAPLLESSLIIRVVPNEELQLSDLKAAERLLSDQYPATSPVVEEISKTTTEGGRTTSSTVTKDYGYAFKTADESRGTQFRLDGLVVGRTGNKERWPTFEEEAKRLWDIYRQIAKPTSISLLGLRYINRFDFNDKSCAKYFTTAPNSPPGYPKPDRWFLLTASEISDLQADLTITQFITRPTKPEGTSLMLDLDIQCKKGVLESNMWDRFEALHNVMFTAFKASLTGEGIKFIS